MAVAESVYDEIVERIVREFDRLKIIVFGSRARGDDRDGSDLDLLVVLREVADKTATTSALRRSLPRLPFSVDVWTTDPEEIEQTGDSIGSFLWPVLRQGRVVYGVDERDEHVWLRYAAEDLDAAERMVAGPGWAPRIACFHAEQAAEKGLKAVLVAQRVPLQYTHDLELLRDVVSETRVGRVDVDWSWLSSWGVTPRYLGGVPDATDEDARAAVTAARAVVDAARADVTA